MRLHYLLVAFLLSGLLPGWLQEPAMGGVHDPPSTHFPLTPETEESCNWVHWLEAGDESGACARIMDVSYVDGIGVAVAGYAGGAIEGSLADDLQIDTDSATASMFVKMISEDGEVLWTRSLGAIQMDTSFAFDAPLEINSDQEGNIYIAGCCDVLSDLDPSDGVYWVNPESPLLYIVKLDQDGEFVWVMTIQSPSPVSEGLRLSVNPDGVTTVLFASGAGTTMIQSSVGWDVTRETPGEHLLLRLDADGRLDWMDSWARNEASFQAIDTDQEGGIYIAGSYRAGDFDFDPGSGVVTEPLQGIGHAFLLKLNRGGIFDALNTWGIDIAGNQAVHISPDGTCYVAGYQVGHTITDHDNITLPPYDIFVRCYNPDGTLQWSSAWGQYETLNNPQLAFIDDVLVMYTLLEGEPDAGPGVRIPLQLGAMYDWNPHLWLFTERGAPLANRVWPQGILTEARGLDTDEAGNIFICGSSYWGGYVASLSLDELRPAE